MDDEIDKIRTRGKPCKRPVDISDTSAEQVVRARTVDGPPSPCNHSQATSLHASLFRSSTAVPTTQSLPVQAGVSVSIPASLTIVNKNPNLPQRSVLNHNTPQIANIDSTLLTPEEITNDSDSEEEDLLADRHAPSMKKALWPLKFFEEMAEGFDEMSNMSIQGGLSHGDIQKSHLEQTPEHFQACYR